MKESVKIDPSTVMLMAQEQGYHKRGGRVYADCNGCLRSAVTTGELIHALYSHIAKTHGYQEKSLDEILVCLDKAQRDYQMKRGAGFNPEILYTISNIGEVVFNCDVYQTEVDVTELESNYGSMESIVREVWQKRIHGNAVLEASIKWEPLTSSGTPMKKMFIVMACTTLSYLAFAYSEKVGDFTWQYQYDQAGGAILQDDNNISICVSPQPSGTVIIPSMLGGLPVTGIGYRAFAGCETLTSITIPSNVTSIGYGAFEGCTGLTNVVIEAESINFMTVGANAFETTTTVAIEHIDGLYFGGWTNANGVIISDPFHSTTVVTVSPRWLNEGDEYGEHLIFFEDFERDSMEFELATVGTFPNPACIQDSMGVDGSRGFGFGRSD